MQTLRRVFAVDPRSLRLFRSLLGFALGLDALYRLPVISEFYTDAGIFPRQMLASRTGSTHLFSILRLSGEGWFAALVLGALILLGFGLLFQFHVRLVSLLSYFLVLSVQHRNPHLLFSADVLLRTGLLWSIFLPGPYERDERGLISAAVLLQVAMIYFCAGWMKSAAAWFWQPEAGYYALSLDFYVSAFGRSLRDSPELLKVGTVATFLLERLGWVLFFSPWWTARLRVLAFLLFALLHIAFALTLELGLFPLLDLVFLTLLLPQEFWQDLHFPLPDVLRASGVCRTSATWPREIGAVLALTLITWWNFAEMMPERIFLPKPVGWFLKAGGLAQGWSVFAPEPMRESGWFLIRGVKANGQSVDPLRLSDSPPSEIPPPSVLASLPNGHWLQYLVKISLEPRPALRQRFAEFLCENWQRHKREPLNSVDLIYMVHRSPPPGVPPAEPPTEPEPRLIVHGKCTR